MPRRPTASDTRRHGCCEPTGTASWFTNAVGSGVRPSRKHWVATSLLVCDVARIDDVRRLADRAREHGPIDTWLHNAGVWCRSARRGRSRGDLCGERPGAAPTDPFVVRRAAGPVALAGSGPVRTLSAWPRHRASAGRSQAGHPSSRHLVARGTYRASGTGEPPIGCNVVFCGVKIFRIADGTIVELATRTVP